MEVITHPNKLLETVCDQIDIDNAPVNFTELKEEMFDVIIKNNGTGVSANQIGETFRAFAMMNSSTNNINERKMLAINPEIIEVDEQEVDMWESCLSFPGVTLQISRPCKVLARWTNELGKTREEWLSGYSARTFLRLIDLLNGVTMQEHVTPSKWKEALANA